ncbi:MAG: PilZ domain-containing protein [Phycisphaerae bacterium]|nr:PilZ domain-containing protein [Phycisphaerae bacterium]
MRLSSQLYADITGITDAPASAAPDERRRSARIELARRARIFPLIESEANAGQLVLVRDISLDGVGILIGEPMSVGDEFVIHIPTASGEGEPVQIQCAARRCHPGGSGKTQFVVGATFELVLNRPLSYAVHIPTEEELNAEAAAAEQSPASDAPPPPSPVEKQFDEQLAESIANRPALVTVDRLTKFPIIRWIILRLLKLFAPLIRLGRKIGIIPRADKASRIRSRLSNKRRKSVPKLSDLAGNETKDKSIGDVKSSTPTPAAQVTATAIESAGRCVAELATAAQSAASPLTAGAPPSAPPNMPPSMATGAAAAEPTAPSGERRSLFAPAAAEPPPAAEAPPATPAAVVEPATAVAESPSPAVAPAAPVVVPTFELPAVIPIELPAAAAVSPADANAEVKLEIRSPTTPESAPAALPSMSPVDVALHPMDPRLNVPPEPAEVKRKPAKGAAWRSRHRGTLNHSPIDRPRLGR